MVQNITISTTHSGVGINRLLAPSPNVLGMGLITYNTIRCWCA